MYKCLKSDFEKLSKRINRIINKAIKYDIDYRFEIINETVESVRVIDYTEPNNPIIKDNVLVEIVNYEFHMEEIRLGDYDVIAILEHGVAENSKANLIHLIDENVKLDSKYRNIDGLCQHCNTNRRRKKTALLKDRTSKEIIQVGLTCLKDYTGIKDIDIIKHYMSIQDIIIEDIYIDFNNYNMYPQFAKTEKYLAHSIKLIKENGYIKDETKHDAWNNIDNKIDIKYINEAKEVIEYFANNEFENNFLTNTKLLLQNEYSRTSGLIAYAYLAYKKQVEWEEKQEAIKRSEMSSKYVGKVKERITSEVTLINIFSFETIYGIQRIYIMKDDRDNILKWKTSVILRHPDNEIIEVDDKFIIRGTVKTHELYKKTKQTELTRCKVMTKLM